MDDEKLIQTLSQALLELYWNFTKSGRGKTYPLKEAKELLIELGYLHPNGTFTQAGRELRKAD